MISKNWKAEMIRDEIRELVSQQIGILQALNQIDMSIYDTTNPQIKSIKAYCQRLKDKEQLLELKLKKIEEEE